MAFDSEYREYVAKLVVEDRRGVLEVCRELELSSTTVTRWVAKYREKLSRNNKAPYRTQKELEQAEKQLLKKIDRLKEENDILKKAMHIFTQDQS
ncbi:MAG: transposase [Sporolactobacillus sp.]